MQTQPNLTIQELGPGLQAVFGGICNRGIIASQGSALVIDAGVGVAEATPLHAAALAQREGGTLALFNTHPHLDHVGGNQVFADMPIIAHHGVRQDINDNGPTALANFQKNPQMAAQLGDVTLTLPTLTFPERLTLFVGEFEVQLIYMGIAHSPSDSVAWLPQAKTLFAGDLLFNERVPAMPPGGNIANWITALNQLEQLGAEHVLPGHGPLQPPTALSALRAWLELLRDQVRAAITQGQDRETTMANIPATMQTRAPRTAAERLPNMVGLVYDQLNHEHMSA